jgi:geranylgeranyl diphosphate synthase, type II
VNRSAAGEELDTGPDVNGYLEVEAARVDSALEEVVRRYVPGTAEPLLDPVEYALSTAGKRLRPILCINAYSAAAGSDASPPAVLYRLSCALEIVHTYSLVHDDLPCMDDDDVRRGRPTVHKVFGPARATLAGAALLPIAVEVLDAEGEALGLDVPTRGRLVVELTRAAGAEGMVGGQLLDLESEGKRLEAAQLERIHAAKTGALLIASLRIGALAGEAEPDLLEALTRYGHALGIAFQITDDLLDVEGDPGVTGKTGRRDIALRKASYPSLHGVEGARALAEAQVARAKRALGGYRLPHLEGIADFVIRRRK